MTQTDAWLGRPPPLGSINRVTAFEGGQTHLCASLQIFSLPCPVCVEGFCNVCQRDLQLPVEERAHAAPLLLVCSVLCQQ